MFRQLSLCRVERISVEDRLIEVMVSGFWSGVFCVFCLVVVQAAWADDCTSYWDTTKNFHRAQHCSKYCCGDCRNKYCCNDKKYHLTEEQQQLCLQRPVVSTNTDFLPSANVLRRVRSLTQPGLEPATSRIRVRRTAHPCKGFAIFVGIAVAVVIFVVLFVVLLICCLVPCCVLYQCCHRTGTPRQTTVTNTSFSARQPPYSPSGHQPAYGGYQFVPGNARQPMPTAPPPPYLEINDPVYSPTAFPQVHPPHPLSQPQSPPPYSEELEHPPYNPSYGPQP
ncbi:protein shisa-5-like [Kryptolebias marmoratus]|uniref:Protein shisa-5 n=1 Tax=Kryptolebias marmoratus TaxID=37003 RepID=A0A3Q3AUU1_KRYMA|nr:protein shisa-5-like [Kryptolebias marmoratus]